VRFPQEIPLHSFAFSGSCTCPDGPTWNSGPGIWRVASPQQASSPWANVKVVLWAGARSILAQACRLISSPVLSPGP